MANIRVAVTRTSKNGGVKQVAARVEAGAIGLGLRAIALSLHSHILECFVRQADPWGKAWPPPKPSTLTNRLRRTQRGRRLMRGGGRGGAGRGLALAGALASSKALIDRGTYRASIYTIVEPPGRIIAATGDIRANVLQFGNPKNRFPNGTWRSRGRLGALGGGLFRTREGQRTLGPGPRAPIPPRPHFPIRPTGQVDAPQAWMDEWLEIMRDALLGGSGVTGRGGAAPAALGNLRIVAGVGR